MDVSKYNPEFLESKAPEIFALAREAGTVDEVREALSQHAYRMEFETFHDYDAFAQGSIIRVRDCARLLIRILTRRSEHKAQFSLAAALRDLAHKKPRPDLSPAFYADLLHFFLGLEGRGPGSPLVDLHLIPVRLEGREAAIKRSRQLDELSAEVKIRQAKYTTGLEREAIRRRENRRDRMLKVLGASRDNWYDWKWQVANILRDPDQIAPLVVLTEEEKEAIAEARKGGLPFGITPHYLSLMDDDIDTDRDRSIRAQVIPPLSYVQQMTAHGEKGRECLDFMKETDTSPANLITRRYPDICIFKPFNACPQICVYCQRNWEIEDAMEPGALASVEDLEAGLRWIADHPAIHEVLVTGGDPLAMVDEEIEFVLEGIARIPTVERIRVGSRVFVTMPMRVTDTLADLLAKYNVPGQRRVAVVTHAQHSYELTPDTVAAVEKLLTRGIPVYNQLVYTFYVSRRFEAAFLRRTLALLGIEPYYTFNTKGKEETIEYMVPLARLLQEQTEEARLLPGLARTDEAVYNVPGLGKNYLRARQHRDLIAILPDGGRLYEFHPWEKNISPTGLTHVCRDVPILDYLQRLEDFGEDVSDYETIWYYF